MVHLCLMETIFSQRELDLQESRHFPEPGGGPSAQLPLALPMSLLPGAFTGQQIASFQGRIKKMHTRLHIPTWALSSCLSKSINEYNFRVQLWAKTSVMSMRALNTRNAISPQLSIYHSVSFTHTIIRQLWKGILQGEAKSFPQGNHSSL